MTAESALVCFSHLRWGFVFQRPNHLMSRAAQQHRTYFVEEPVFGDGPPRFEKRAEAGLTVCVPHLPHGLDGETVVRAQRDLLDALLAEERITRPILWFYTPMALAFAGHLEGSVTVYDCMDELSLFHGAPPELRAREAELFGRADLVFTGGQSLYEAKRASHPRVHAFPSSVDAPHFAKARDPGPPPPDQESIPAPRVGYFGVIDERLDLDLLAKLADADPSCQIVMIGPVVKIDPDTLPRRDNIHYLGQKRYEELPAYIAGWDVALMPFARNDATRFISPTKTLEYLAAGKPVVSTAIRDVVRPYGERGLVRIGDAETFPAEVAAAMADTPERRAAGDAFVAETSWAKTWQSMASLIAAASVRTLEPGARTPTTAARKTAAEEVESTCSTT